MIVCFFKNWLCLYFGVTEYYSLRGALFGISVIFLLCLFCDFV